MGHLYLSFNSAASNVIKYHITIITHYYTINHSNSSFNSHFIKHILFDAI